MRTYEPSDDIIDPAFIPQEEVGTRPNARDLEETDSATEEEDESDVESPEFEPISPPVLAAHDEHAVDEATSCDNLSPPALTPHYSRSNTSCEPPSPPTLRPHEDEVGPYLTERSSPPSLSPHECSPTRAILVTSVRLPQTCDIAEFSVSSTRAKSVKLSVSTRYLQYPASYAGVSPNHISQLHHRKLLYPLTSEPTMQHLPSQISAILVLAQHLRRCSDQRPGGRNRFHVQSVLK